jgi:hypothetical protein
MIEGRQPTKEGVITSKPEEDVQPSQQPMEQAAEALAAEALAAELLKELLPTLVAESPAELPRASKDAVAPLAEALHALPENRTSGKRKAEQTDKVVSIAETLLNELITWKEMNDEESS